MRDRVPSLFQFSDIWVLSQLLHYEIFFGVILALKIGIVFSALSELCTMPVAVKNASLRLEFPRHDYYAAGEVIEGEVVLTVKRSTPLYISGIGTW